MKLAAAVLLNLTLLFGEENQYAVSLITAELLPADAVVRVYDTKFEIKNIKRAILTAKRAITVFSKKEEDAGKLMLWYDKYHSIEELEGTIYDAHGEEIKSLEDSDIKDYPAFDDGALHTDSRYKLATLFHNSYPYTIEYTYEIEFNGSLNWPDWYAQRSIHPVEKSEFKVLCPQDYALRYWCNRDSIEPTIISEKGNKIYHWSATALKKFEDEDARNSLRDMTTVVKIAPAEFQMDDYKGLMVNWSDFGKWCYALYKDRDKLPAKDIEEIKDRIASLKSTREKIKSLYEYMQSKTRYVSIQLGIGGWQPFDAEFVSSHGYGDCKALVNYMAAILKQVGIQSYPVLIHGGTDLDPMVVEFPSNQFNHVILSVPFEKDTVWLECTSQHIPFNTLSDFTENRTALLLTSNGGVVVHTPSTSSAENLQDRFITVWLNINGSANASITTKLFGNQMIGVQSSLIHKTPDERNQWMLERIEMPDITLKSLAIKGLNDHSPEITLDVTSIFTRYASVSGGRMFFNPNILEKRLYVPPPMEKRKSPIHYDYPYLDRDSVYFAIPNSHFIETLPKEVFITSSFGTYQGKTVALGDTAVVHTRRIEICQTKIPPDQYNEYRNFWSSVAKVERAQVVLKMK